MKTKNLILTLLLMVCVTSGLQAQKENIFFTKEKLTNKFHTIDELKSLNKGELITLYSERVREIMVILPYLPLANKPGVSMRDVGITETSDNVKVVKKNNEIADRAFEYTSNTINTLIPYADTDKIIWSILYFEEMIKEMRLGTNGRI
ncbi:hypothetical protein [Aquimarina rhabdastrellae]